MAVMPAMVVATAVMAAMAGSPMLLQSLFQLPFQLPVQFTLPVQLLLPLQLMPMAVMVAIPAMVVMAVMAAMATTLTIAKQSLPNTHGIVRPANKLSCLVRSVLCCEQRQKNFTVFLVENSSIIIIKKNFNIIFLLIFIF